MSTRSERDKQKSLQERHQLILTNLLKDEDNKYCVDCDAKGPRWASWNLGIFLCIRCAGIHRNLGVHISKVKSVNLDTWTPEQIAMVQEMGNSRARAVYEANLPDNFRRPQTDSSGLEAFIRAKYETKKYIAQEWVPPKPKLQPTYEDLPKKERKKPRPKVSGSVQLNSAQASAKTSVDIAKPAKPASEPPAKVMPSEPAAAAVDLLGLDNPTPSQNIEPKSDPFGDFISGTGAPPAVGGPQVSCPVGTEAAATASLADPAATNGLSDVNLFGESAASQEKQKATKESILALYGSSTNSQMFGVPGGVYMPQGQQQPQQQMWATAGAMPNGMMANNTVPIQGNVGMMGAQPSGMIPASQQQPQQASMMGGMPAMQGQMMPNMYNMGQYGMNPQQQQYQQVQSGLSGLSLGGAGGMPQQQQQQQQQPGMVAAGGTSGPTWGGQPSGQTFSTNLWQ